MSASKDFTIRKGVLTKYKGPGGDVVIPEGVTSIYMRAFDFCSSVTSITIPEGVTSIGLQAFNCCSSLASITIPDGVTSIAYDAFAGCSSLVSITIPESVTSIGDSAFSGCSSLESITIPEHITNIDSLGLRSCKRLADADGHIVVNHVYISYCRKKLHAVIPNGVTSIGAGAFNGCGFLKSIAIPEGVTSIGDWAFYGCKSITSITLHDGVASIGTEAFDGCGALAHLTIPASVKEIGEGAIDGCPESIQVFADIGLMQESKWKRAVVLAYLHDPAPLAFCEDRIIQYIKRKKKEWISEILENDMDYAITNFLQKKIITKRNIDADYLQPAIEANAAKCTALLLDWKGRNVSQEEEERRFERELSKDLYNVTDMRKLWKYKKLEDGTLCITAYKGDSTAIEIPPRIGKDTVSAIGDKAFTAALDWWGNPAPRRAFFVTIRSITIPAGVTSIGNLAFTGCKSLVSIEIPDSVTSIGYDAFKHCESLMGVTIPNGVTSINFHAFFDCRSLVDVTISKGVGKIESGAFYGCSALTNITIPESVTKIRAGAFSDCTSLTSVTIAGSVTIIDNATFSGCTSLASITLPDGVKEIGSWAFSDCSALKSITIPSSVTQIYGAAFKGRRKLTICTPAGSYAEKYARENNISVITTAEEERTVL